MGYEFKDNEAGVVVNSEGTVSVVMPTIVGKIDLAQRPEMLLALAFSRVLTCNEGIELTKKFMDDIMREVAEKTSPCGDCSCDHDKCEGCRPTDDEGEQKDE